MRRENKDIGPVLLKFGVAIALSVGGMLYCFLRNKRFSPPESPSDPQKSSDCSNQVNSGKELLASKNDHQASQTTTSSFHFDPLAKDNHVELRHSNNPVPSYCQINRSTGDRDAYLLPEFNDLVKGFDLAVMKANMSPKKDTESLQSDTESPKGYSSLDRSNHEQEVKNLRNLVKNLEERERNLEVQLLEYYGLKEQETAATELQNRLKLNNMEAKLLSLKIESLQAENRRLEAQMADQGKVVADLEAARAKIKALKKKLKSEAEQNKKQILDLQQRVQKMQEEEQRGVAGIDPEIQSRLNKMKDLEAEVEELRMSNHNLELEKSDLAQRLEGVQIIATSVLEDEASEKLKEESERLRKQNEDLSKEVERLQADTCADVEELVYLRWINACLRYELRNYQPGPGKTIARDLSKTLSPKSEEKAKQLILEYANKEGVGEKATDIPEVDSDQWSSSQASFATDSGEFDESFFDDSSMCKTNNKFFGKLMKLLRAKDGHGHRHHRHGHRRTSSIERSESGGSDVSCSDSSVGHLESHRLRTSSAGSSKYSLDSQRSINRRSNASGSGCIYKSIDSIAEGGNDGYSGSPASSDGRKSELVKYAEALKETRVKSKAKHRRRSSSLSGFG